MKQSVESSRIAIRMAISESREEEAALKTQFQDEGARCLAIDFGGQFLPTMSRILEHAVVAAQRQRLVAEDYVGAGAVAGATNEALEQLKSKAIGHNVGGKIGIARKGENLSVAIYMGVGVLHLNEIAISVAHRSLRDGLERSGGGTASSQILDTAPDKNRG